jgi:hypothetical protein
MAQRKPTKTAQTRGQGPEPDQIKALERMIRRGDFPQASKQRSVSIWEFRLTPPSP